MRILPEYIAEKSLAGTTSDGEPVLYVYTKGGLHAFFTKNDEGIITLGAAPHRGIAAWMAEKRSPGIQWKPEENIAKSEEDRFNTLRSVVFAPKGKPSALIPELFVVYNWKKRYMDLLSREEVGEAIAKGENPGSLVRKLDMSDDVMRLEDWKNGRK